MNASSTTLFQDVQLEEEEEDHVYLGEHTKDWKDERRQQRWRERRTDAFQSNMCAVGLPGGSMAYLDFLVLVNGVESYRMHHCSSVYVAATMIKQIICLNTSTFSLVAMFAVSMAMQRLDILNGMDLLFFVGLACILLYILHRWSIIVAYTTLHIAVLFTIMVYNTSYHPNSISYAWIEITDIFIGKNPFVLLVYFILLLLWWCCKCVFLGVKGVGISPFKKFFNEWNGVATYHVQFLHNLVSIS
ncbi:hypothetical protein TraAM80_02365 [Trypanosoma rangeli]|uniref:Uncharacterized protein n=1 Tax=Trypanosoma rangeli TaxID=5698 RepID=A0A422NU30_TRYRA|nr:uncharacterized protein TraAM80_02365 [Trypanosoma rangeli]RNF08958.1 hypothetical protein TraAM80_02365 [Trypanosoma rangeli]|eukprot:RNF08958.1 hypothetical protein TraAM80_02365 [Trypanosoma rangeli]